MKIHGGIMPRWSVRKSHNWQHYQQKNVPAVGRPENALLSTHQADRVMAGGARLWARTSG